MVIDREQILHIVTFYIIYLLRVSKASSLHLNEQIINNFLFIDDLRLVFGSVVGQVHNMYVVAFYQHTSKGGSISLRDNFHSIFVSIVFDAARNNAQIEVYVHSPLMLYLIYILCLLRTQVHAILSSHYFYKLQAQPRHRQLPACCT